MVERLEVDGLIKNFAAAGRGEQSTVRAVNSVSFTVDPGEMLTLLGPSGCGKTTTLRCVAGLATPDDGKISIGDRVLFSSELGVRVPANERGIGMVFQSYAIWPHMNVFKNVAFPLQVKSRRTRPSKRTIQSRVEEALSVVQLEHLSGRSATALSGGQQQRLALARALVMEPPLLLLDEPLSNLDAKLRERMRFGLKSLQRRLGITAVYVTHDQTEALTMSHKIAVMNEGKVEQVGRPRDIYEHPSSKFVAEFIGNSNLIDGRVTSFRAEADEAISYEIETPAGLVAGRLSSKPPWMVGGAAVMVAVRPECISIETAEGRVDPAPNQWSATVSARAFAGESVEYLLAVNTLEIQVRSSPAVSIPADAKVTLRLDSERIQVFPAEEF